MYDTIVVGGGVVGALILKELSRYDLKVLLLEKEDDLSAGASGANSGIVHAGYDCVPGTLKARFNVRGNAMFPELCKSLGVSYRNTGSLVVAGENGLTGLQELKDRGEQNGVFTEIFDRKGILKIEPHVAERIKYALWAPSAGIASPFKLTIAAADYAVVNGAEVHLEEEVTAVSKHADGFTVTTDKGSYQTRTVVNAAGAGAMKINQLVGEETFSVEYRKGEYYLLDKAEGANVNTVIFPLPDENGKGILVAPTGSGNVIYGPTSVLCDADDTSVGREGLEDIKSKLPLTYGAVNYKNVIRLYAGVRTAVGEDFVIKEGASQGYIMLLGICSPGLTASPAIAEYVVGELLAKRLNLVKKAEKPLPLIPKMISMTPAELNRNIKQNPMWGKVVCRCETVSEAEVVQAIHSPVKATTLDAVKRRVRVGMGRCQGGFCMPVMLKILARELGVSIDAVKKGGQGSEISLGTIKEIKYEI